MQEVRGSGTNEVAPSGIEEHRKQGRDQGGDQSRDHETKVWGPKGAAPVALRLLAAVGKGDPESLTLASQLVEAVIGDRLAQRALELRELLQQQSPFALVRAIELAERLLGTQLEIEHSSDREAPDG